MHLRPLALLCTLVAMLFGTSSAQAAQSLPAGDPINDSLSRVAAVVDAPRTPSVPVIHNESIVDAGAIQIDVPIQSKRPVTGRNAGEVGLRGKQTDTDFVVQSQADRTRILSVSKSSAAPTVIKYRVVTDPSGTLALQPDGSVHVMNRDGLITSVIEAPWAIDAAGRSVTTSYTIAGSTLVQTIEHRAPGVTYPVTADPSVVSCSTFVACIKFNRSETLRVNNAAITGGVAGMAGSLCGLIPSSPWYAFAFKATCGGYVGANCANIRANSQNAVSTGRCLALRFSVPGGFPLGSQVVSC